MRALLLIVATYICASVQQTPDNLQKHTISLAGINASFIGYGARLTNLFVFDKQGTSRDVVLGYDQGSGYINDTEHEHTYFGAVVGRYAGRMKNGTFTLNGVASHVTENENTGRDSLHGGVVGYDQRNWTIASQDESSITFMLEDNAFEGYPGKVVNYATFSLAASDEGPSLTSRLVSIPLNGPTPIMLTTHPYWNLNAFADASNPNILDHTLHMPYSKRFVEIDNIEVATGGIGVTNDPDKGLLDFTSPRSLGESLSADPQECGGNCSGIDTNFIIDRPPSAGTESIAVNVLTLSSNTTGIKFDLYTNQQALIVYTCNKLNGTIPLKQSQQHSQNKSTVYAMEHGCVAIETQGWIDGVNHPEWGQQEYQVFSSETQPSVMWVRYVFGLT